MLFNGSEVKDDYKHGHALKYTCLAFAKGIGNWAGKGKGRGEGTVHLSPGRTWPVYAAGILELGKRQACFLHF